MSQNLNSQGRLQKELGLPQIVPSEDEVVLFKLMLSTAERVGGVTLRVAGGWVRDQLLCKSGACDIDIMVEGMPADEFAKEFAKDCGVEEHLIRENPEKSKHVRTARVRMTLKSGQTVEVDFAMARSETYGASRIPDVAEGTVEQDALRRDFTVNALFWNIGTGEVEDYCGGLTDLKCGLLRTPVVPSVTFTDDPLRVLRVARFISKLGSFRVESDTFSAMNASGVISSLRTKVSKERIGEEMLKMAMGPEPLRAFNIMKSCRVFEAILSDALAGSEFDGKMGSLDMYQNVPDRHEFKLWEHSVECANEASRLSSGDPDVVLAALLHDFGKAVAGVEAKKPDGSSSYIGHEHVGADLARLFLAHIKLDGGGRGDRVVALVRHHMKPHFLHKSGSAGLRRFVRRVERDGVSWRQVVAVAEADVLSRGNPRLGEPDHFPDTVKAIEKAMSVVVKDKSGRPKPVVNGNEIMEILCVPPGPHMKEMVSSVELWQDVNPAITKEEVAMKLREFYFGGNTAVS